MLNESTNLVQQLQRNTAQFRTGMKKAGFKIIGHDMSPIAPVWLGDAKVASDLSNKLMDENIFVIGFSYPVVPKG